MNKLIKKNLNLIISIFILLHPIIDLITGICLHIFNLNFTFGNIIRILFLALIMYITTFIYKKKNPSIYYLIVIIYSWFYFIGCIIIKDGIGIFSEIQGLIRTFYFPMILLSLYELKEEMKIKKELLVITLSIYLLCIFIPIMFGIGFKSYQITKNGTLGFYNSANEIGGIISIITPIVFIVFINNKRNLLKILFTIIYFIVIFSVGTKTPLLSLLITIGMLFLWILIKCVKEKKYKTIICAIILLISGVIGLILVIPKTNFYKNIEVHLDYLEVDNIFDVIKDEELIDHFIFSQRLTFWNNREDVFKDVGLYQKLIGIGYLEEGKLSKLVEMDYIDIYYSHGIIGFIIFFSTYIFVLIKVFKTKEKLNFERYMTIVSILLILFLSLFTGHIITAPAVSLIAIIIILSLNNKQKVLS